ncbi:MAG: cytochrome P450 [Sphaerobacter sp.]|nr:cytochrome P450 [Sphaerobacter sp.]
MDTARFPPGPRRLPVVGNAYQYRRDPLGFVRAAHREFGDIATMYVGAWPIVLCFRPEHVRFFLVERAAAFTPVGVAPNLMETLGEGLLTTDGEFHDQQRRLLQPAFHRRRVEHYAATMVARTEEMLDRWRPGDEIDVAQWMSALTLRIVSQALFGVDQEAAGAELNRAFVDLIANSPETIGLIRLPRLNLPHTRYGRYMAARRRLDAYVYDLIDRRRAAGTDGDDVLSWLLTAGADGTGLTDRQVRDQTVTLLAAGHDTTALALTWTLFLLSQHREAREKLLAELRAVLGDRPPTPDDLSRLPYLDWVVTESMRIYPPAWAQGRVALEPFELEGYRFPAGTHVMFSQWVIHHRPDIWGDPDRFRPERWDPAQPPPPHWAYFPFGGGPRACIGMPFAQMEARLLLATILQRFVTRLVPGHPVVPAPRITLRPKYGMRMILNPAPAARAAPPGVHAASDVAPPTPHARRDQDFGNQTGEKSTRRVVELLVARSVPRARAPHRLPPSTQACTGRR